MTIINKLTPLLKAFINSPTETSPAAIGLMLREIMSSHATTNQITAFLVALKLSGLDCNPEVVAECAHVLRSCSLHVDISSLKSRGIRTVDIVGTGGDGHDTFNVSTTAGLVAAGAGCYVAKHGNRASSSSCGSADILEALDIPIASISPVSVASLISSTNFCFLFAQRYHPAMKHVAKERKELGVPTIFNLLGPLSNPVKTDGAVIGVFKKELGMLVAESLKLMGVERAIVVCGEEGLDEVSPAGPSYVWSLENSSITSSTINPIDDFGISKLHPLSSVRGGDKVHNAEILRSLLQNELPRDHPILDYVLMNAAVVCVVSGIAKDWKEGVEVARKSIESGSAWKVLQQFRQEVIKSQNH
ncbi:glycosyl transferase family, a/b domain-containing protein [Paraphysoderma sedebokerense]|nr:glycosyl transferase family, a/b domain-containing protein [Paraphysoderma sedebokerense]